MFAGDVPPSNPTKSGPIDLDAIQNLIVGLLLNASAISGYALPAQAPEVHLVPAKQIHDRVCGKPCRARAFFAPGEGIFLDAALDLQLDFYDRSILVHELAHFLQHSSDRFESKKGVCARHSAEETEAYDIQNKYLSQADDPRRFAFVAPPGGGGED